MKKIYIVFFALFIVVKLSAQVFTDSNLPIVIINTDIDPNTGLPTEIVDEPKVVASMKVIYHTDGTRNFVTDQNNPDFLDYDGRIGIEFRGSSSQSLPKKPYGLETRLIDDETKNNVSILGMPKENDWVLNSLAFDKSLVRDYLSYDLARGIGDYAARGIYCEVVINGDYKGLYIFMEKIKTDSNRINVADIEVDDNQLPEVTGGYFTKCDKVNADETIAWSYPTATGVPANFLHEQPKQEDVTPQQTSYIKSVFDNLKNTAFNQNSSISNGYPSVIDIPSFVDFMLLSELASNVDSYQYSTYYHKDRGGKLRAGPVWDFNLTYGNDFGTIGRSGTEVWQFDNDDNVGPAFWKNLFDNPEFKCYLSKRWQDLTAAGETLDYNALNDEIDLLGNLLAEAKVREQQRWGTLDGYEIEITNLKSWLQDRYTFLNSNFIVTGNCSFPETPTLVISKINYHPEATGGFEEEDLEFIGITNNSNETILLTGVYFRALGVSYQFTEGSTIDSGKIIYLVNNTQAFEDFYGVTAFGEYFRDLSNKSQQMQLADAFGNTIDNVIYEDKSPWPEEADGEGPYLVLNDLNSDNSLGVNWSATEEILLGINDLTTNFTDTKVFPNPSKGYVYIQNKNMPIVKAQVYDQLGRLILVNNIQSNEIQLDLNGKTKSIYILKVTLEDGTSVIKKIIKQ